MRNIYERQAGPLLALRAGDTVRATEDAWAAILLSGGRGSFKVHKANSPFAVLAAKPEEGKGQKAMSLLEASLGFLSSAAKEEPRATLSTRGGARPPVILTPRRDQPVHGPDGGQRDRGRDRHDLGGSRCGKGQDRNDPERRPARGERRRDE